MSELIYEKSRPGRITVTLDKLDVNQVDFSDDLLRQAPLRLPQIAEIDLVRHYIELSRNAFGVDNGFYPLGSCTMKYNPRLNEECAALEGFTQLHPLQPISSTQGALRAMELLSESLCEITGMNAFTLQPSAGAHGEFTGMLMIHAYHAHRNDLKRTKVIVPDSAHGTNPASAAMAGYQVVSVASNPEGGVDLDALKALLSDEVAALMLTNPNTLGLFDSNIEEISRLVHEAGGLVYYDGANLNAIMGIARPLGPRS